MKQWITTVFALISLLAGLQARADEAMPAYAKALCKNPAFQCRQTRSSDTWAKLWPNPRHRDLVMRINRTNIPLRNRDWIIVPKNIKQVDYMALSPFPQQIDPPGQKLVVIDLSVFAFGAYNADGRLVRWGPATGGKAWCDDMTRSCLTAAGDYKIYRIQGPNCVSSQFPMETGGGAPMQYCMHFYKGFAIHASTLSGFVNKSRGCVRTFDADARWLNHRFVKLGTEVIVRR